MHNIIKYGNKKEIFFEIIKQNIYCLLKYKFLLK